MNCNKTLLSALATVAAASAIGAGIAPAARAQQPADEVIIIAAAPISPQQAAVAAEQATGGRAVATEVGERNGTMLYEVTLVKSNTQYKAQVDPQSGAVVTAEVGGAGNTNDTGGNNYGNYDYYKTGEA